MAFGVVKAISRITDVESKMYSTYDLLGFFPTAMIQSNMYGWHIINGESTPFLIKKYTFVELIPKMTSNTSPAPFVASVSSMYSASYDAYCAFNKDATTVWLVSGTTGWLKLFFGAPTLVTSYYMNEEKGARMPKSWSFEGSQDNTAWVVLDTRANIVWKANETIEFPIASPDAYNYYRINVTENSGDANYMSIDELQFVLGTPVSISGGATTGFLNKTNLQIRIGITI